MELNGPQWRQLPLLMTHHEVAGLHSNEFGVPVSHLSHRFETKGGNRGGPGEDEEDQQHVDEIADRIYEHGYDERYPLQVVSQERGKDILWNGNHRAAAVAALGHPLTPVVFHGGMESRIKEFKKQQDTEIGDYDSGRQTPLSHTGVRGYGG